MYIKDLYLIIILYIIIKVGEQYVTFLDVTDILQRRAYIRYPVKSNVDLYK